MSGSYTTHLNQNKVTETVPVALSSVDALLPEPVEAKEVVRVIATSSAQILIPRRQMPVNGASLCMQDKTNCANGTTSERIPRVCGFATCGN
jgi:hypothetical protein